MAGLVEWYNYIFYELADPRSSEYWLLSSPLPILAIIAVYLYFVNSLGPQLMKNRPPFKLEGPIQVYNLFQIAYCMYMLISIHRYKSSNFLFFCEPIYYSYDDEYGLNMLRLSWCFFMLKLIDLLDTVFFVLRKKFAQVTFLHVYHHALMFFMVWIGAKYVAGGHGCIVGYANCYVHIIMYGYYFVTNRWPEYKKNLWWKKYITIIQIMQFLLIGVVTLPLLFINCPYPKAMTYFIIIQNFVMLKLFIDFYRKSYLSKKDK